MKFHRQKFYVFKRAIKSFQTLENVLPMIFDKDKRSEIFWDLSLLEQIIQLDDN